MQFLVGWIVFGEEMSAGRWAGFILIWCALALITVDSLVGVHNFRKTRTNDNVADTSEACPTGQRHPVHGDAGATDEGALDAAEISNVRRL